MAEDRGVCPVVFLYSLISRKILFVVFAVVDWVLKIKQLSIHLLLAC